MAEDVGLLELVMQGVEAADCFLLELVRSLRENSLRRRASFGNIASCFHLGPENLFQSTRNQVVGMASAVFCHPEVRKAGCMQRCRYRVFTGRQRGSLRVYCPNR